MMEGGVSLLCYLYVEHVAGNGTLALKERCYKAMMRVGAGAEADVWESLAGVTRRVEAVMARAGRRQRCDAWKSCVAARIGTYLERNAVFLSAAMPLPGRAESLSTFLKQDGTDAFLCFDARLAKRVLRFLLALAKPHAGLAALPPRVRAAEPEPDVQDFYQVLEQQMRSVRVPSRPSSVESEGGRRDLGGAPYRLAVKGASRESSPHRVAHRSRSVESKSGRDLPSHAESKSRANQRGQSVESKGASDRPHGMEGYRVHEPPSVEGKRAQRDAPSQPRSIYKRAVSREKNVPDEDLSEVWSKAVDHVLSAPLAIHRDPDGPWVSELLHWVAGVLNEAPGAPPAVFVEAASTSKVSMVESISGVRAERSASMEASEEHVTSMARQASDSKIPALQAPHPEIHPWKAPLVALAERVRSAGLILLGPSWGAYVGRVDALRALRLRAQTATRVGALTGRALRADVIDAEMALAHSARDLGIILCCGDNVGGSLQPAYPPLEDWPSLGLWLQAHLTALLELHAMRRGSPSGLPQHTYASLLDEILPLLRSRVRRARISNIAAAEVLTSPSLTLLHDGALATWCHREDVGAAAAAAARARAAALPLSAAQTTLARRVTAGLAFCTALHTERGASRGLARPRFCAVPTLLESVAAAPQKCRVALTGLTELLKVCIGRDMPAPKACEIAVTRARALLAVPSRAQRLRRVCMHINNAFKANLRDTAIGADGVGMSTNGPAILQGADSAVDGNPKSKRQKDLASIDGLFGPFNDSSSESESETMDDSEGDLGEVPCPPAPPEVPPPPPLALEIIEMEAEMCREACSDALRFWGPQTETLWAVRIQGAARLCVAAGEVLRTLVALRLAHAVLLREARRLGWQDHGARKLRRTQAGLVGEPGEAKESAAGPPHTISLLRLEKAGAAGGLRAARARLRGALLRWARSLAGALDLALQWLALAIQAWAQGATDLHQQDMLSILSMHADRSASKLNSREVVVSRKVEVGDATTLPQGGLLDGNIHGASNIQQSEGNMENIRTTAPPTEQISHAPGAEPTTEATSNFPLRIYIDTTTTTEDVSNSLLVALCACVPTFTALCADFRAHRAGSGPPLIQIEAGLTRARADGAARLARVRAFLSRFDPLSHGSDARPYVQSVMPASRFSLDTYMLLFKTTLDRRMSGIVDGMA